MIRDTHLDQGISSLLIKHSFCLVSSEAIGDLMWRPHVFTGTITDYTCARVAIYCWAAVDKVMQTPLSRLLLELNKGAGDCGVRRAPEGRGRPRKALSPFCQSTRIEWIMYVTPGGPTDSSKTQMHRIELGNLEARGQLGSQAKSLGILR